MSLVNSSTSDAHCPSNTVGGETIGVAREPWKTSKHSNRKRAYADMLYTRALCITAHAHLTGKVYIPTAQ